MNRLSITMILVLILSLFILITGCEETEDSPTVVPTITAAPTATATIPTTATPSPGPTQTLAPTATPEATLTPVPTESPSLPYQNILLVNLITPYYADALDALRDDGYTVDPLDSLTALDEQLLTEYGVVIIKGGSLTSAEISTLVNWIKAGGSALFLAELGVTAQSEFNFILSPLCGIEVNSDNVKDLTHKFPYGQQNGIRTGVVFDHPATRSVSELAFFTTDGLPSLKITGDKAIVIVEGEQQAYSTVYSHNPPLAAAAECEAGRIVVVAGSNNRNCYTFGDLSLGINDNPLFLSNIIAWLSHQ